MENRYTEKIEMDAETDIYTINEWRQALDMGLFWTYDGCGFWCKDGYKSIDEVFSTPQLDATHVIWFNK